MDMNSWAISMISRLAFTPILRGSGLFLRFSFWPAVLVGVGVGVGDWDGDPPMAPGVELRPAAAPGGGGRRGDTFPAPGGWLMGVKPP